ncbi:hypothetical protein CDD83_5224 [Cordyceps sp. RAO-2017]|nr:hypothetical protein CDD83_5224 [Cordyceps sp. RAO-2017]
MQSLPPTRLYQPPCTLHLANICISLTGSLIARLDVPLVPTVLEQLTALPQALAIGIPPSISAPCTFWYHHTKRQNPFSTYDNKKIDGFFGTLCALIA